MCQYFLWHVLDGPMHGPGCALILPAVGVDAKAASHRRQRPKKDCQLRLAPLLCRSKLRIKATTVNNKKATPTTTRKGGQ
jgi:hypothetical protein